MEKAMNHNRNCSGCPEQVSYNCKEHPAYIRKDLLSHYPDFSAVSHWHEDLEFILVLSGHMSYNVNGCSTNLETGNGILVNSRQLHHGYSSDHTECEFICILLHPLLLCASEYYGKQYVEPLISSAAQPFIPLYGNIAWQNGILQILKRICGCLAHEDSILKIQPLIHALWIPLYKNFPKRSGRPKGQQLTAVRQMISFIQNHYKESLSLAMIADSGHVRKSSCRALFHKYLSRTPVAYLTGYRLDRSLPLLLHTGLNITEISSETGFNSASYFSETFKKNFHCTPLEYRNKYYQSVS